MMEKKNILLKKNKHVFIFVSLRYVCFFFLQRIEEDAGIAQELRTFGALVEDPPPILSTHMVADNCLKLQLPRI